jgi:hypothetical protein
MDPYLEQFWGDIHHRLVTYTADSVQKALPSDLRARVDERVFVEPAEDRPRSIVPDARVVERGRPGEPLLLAGDGIAVAEPLVIDLGQDEPVRQGFICREEPDPPLAPDDARWSDRWLRAAGRR